MLQAAMEMCLHLSLTSFYQEQPTLKRRRPMLTLKGALSKPRLPSPLRVAPEKTGKSYELYRRWYVIERGILCRDESMWKLKNCVGGRLCVIQMYMLISGGSRGQSGLRQLPLKRLWRSVKTAPLWCKCTPFWCLTKSNQSLKCFKSKLNNTSHFVVLQDLRAGLWQSLLPIRINNVILS